MTVNDYPNPSPSSVAEGLGPNGAPSPDLLWHRYVSLRRPEPSMRVQVIWQILPLLLTAVAYLLSRLAH